MRVSGPVESLTAAGIGNRDNWICGTCQDSTRLVDSPPGTPRALMLSGRLLQPGRTARGQHHLSVPGGKPGTTPIDAPVTTATRPVTAAVVVPP